MKEKLKVFSNGLLKENPSLRLVLGTCPTLAVTTDGGFEKYAGAGAIKQYAAACAR